MLENIDLSKTLNETEYDKNLDEFKTRLGKLQRELKDLNIPVIIVFEGWGASGKGTLINNLISSLDPRGFKVYSIKKENKEEQMRPFLWRFWTKTPAKGRIVIFDRSWYRRVLNDRVDKKIKKEHLPLDFSEILSFEQQLTDDGTVLIKLFIHISKDEQKKRLSKLSKNSSTSWRVTNADLRHNKQYGNYLKAFDEMIKKTDTDIAKWNIIEGNNYNFAAVKIYKIVIDILEKKILDFKNSPAPLISSMISDREYQSSLLSNIDLTKDISKDDYEKKLKEYQTKLYDLHNNIYLKRIPLIIVFEGWDASGKGGSIRRLTQNLDPRGYEVIPTTAPTDSERAHHYLWKFWNTIPKAGHIAIYDRSWYGRVLVERIEGYCTTDDWQRAYKEINEMEENLANFGTIIIKFWLHIDKDT